MSEVADVVVVGGSVAGSATALHLARRGHRVIVLERGTFPREKPCGEGLMPHGVAELASLGILAELEPSSRPFRGIAYHIGSATAVGEFPALGGRQGGLGVRRVILDKLLVDACVAAGVDFRTQVRTGDLRMSADGVTVDTNTGPVRARAIVGADGLHSAVRKQLKLSQKHDFPLRYGARVHLKLDGKAERDVVDVYIGSRCEFYLTPTGDGEINFALLTGKETTRDLGGELLRGMMKLTKGLPELRRYLNGCTPITQARLCGPLRQIPKSIVAERAVLVGDAAGFIDAITGEGMSLALVSARLAADALSEGLHSGDLSEASLKSYERERHRFDRDMVQLTELVLWWLKQPWLAQHVVRNLGRHPKVFSKMLAVNTGQGKFTDLGIGDARRVILGI